MSDVPLPPIRIGFGYAVQLDFSSGFFDAAEGCRTKLRRFIGDTAIVPATSIVADSVTWELTPEQTAAMPAGTYYAEAEIYTVADPTAKGEVLTDVRYVIPCNHGPSE